VADGVKVGVGDGTVGSTTGGIEDGVLVIVGVGVVVRVGLDAVAGRDAARVVAVVVRVGVTVRAGLDGVELLVGNCAVADAVAGPRNVSVSASLESVAAMVAPSEGSSNSVLVGLGSESKAVADGVAEGTG